MNFLKKMFAPKEVSAALGILDEISCQVKNRGFEVVHGPIEEMILADTGKFSSVVRQSPSIRVWVLSAAANMAGDAVESGEFHTWRGCLNPMGEGLLESFRYCMAQLVKEGQISPIAAAEQNKALLANIQNVG